MLYLVRILFGLVIGSFLNVVIVRLPLKQNLTGRSHCPHCRQTITWYDLIPVISWLMLRGRCRHCRATIGWQYPLVELISAVIFLLAHSVFVLFLAEVFLVLFMTDLQYLLLPDSIVLIGLLGALSFSRFAILTVPHLLTAIALFLFFFLVWWLSRGRWLGLGDSKLALLVGLAFGPIGGILVIYGAIMLGGVVALVLLLSRRAGWQTRLPLGSFISLAAGLYLFWGSAIISYSAALNLILRLWPQ